LGILVSLRTSPSKFGFVVRTGFSTFLGESFFSFDMIDLFIQIYVVFSRIAQFLRKRYKYLPHIGWHIAEGGDYKAQNFKIVQMFNRSKTVYFSTKPPLLAICCYVPFFFINQ